MLPKPPNKNVETTHTESESKASETPEPLDVMVEKTAAKTREEAAKAAKAAHETRTK